MKRVSLVALALAGCNYLLPATWGAFHADPDDAAPSINRALAARELRVAKWDPVARKITSEYVFTSDGVDQTRERYIVRWERNATDDVLIVYVRHEAQEQGSSEGRPVWETATHDPAKEAALLDAITAELERLHRPLPSK